MTVKGGSRAAPTKPLLEALALRTDPWMVAEVHYNRNWHSGQLCLYRKATFRASWEKGRTEETGWVWKGGCYSVDKVADVVLVAMGDGYYISGKFGIITGDSLVKVAQAVSEYHGNRNACGTVDANQLATSNFSAFDQFVKPLSRIPDNPVVLGRFAEINLQQITFSRLIVLDAI